VAAMSLPTVAALAVTAFAAGTVDAIGGGGGLLTVPALLAAGLPPHLALGTNKGQSVFGTAAALLHFARRGQVDAGRARLVFPLALVGSLAGALLVMRIPATALRPVVLVLLAVAALFIGVQRGRPAAAGEARPTRRRGGQALAGLVALVVGAYDGFFGPGTGTFLIVAFVALLGDGLVQASAEAKVANFASNLAALALFWSRGLVIWSVALPMAAGQLAGGFLGAHLTLRRGDKLVRRVAVVVALALAAKVALDLRGG
jgi:uncharacterized protein